MPPAVAAQVRRCGALRALACDLADVELVLALPHLESLTLYASNDRSYRVFAKALAALASVTQALQQQRQGDDLGGGGLLANLRSLDVNHDRGEVGTHTHPSKSFVEN